MSEHFFDIDLIQRYLDRSLSDEEKASLEQRLRDEPGLRTMYQEHQLLIKGIHYAHLQRKLEQLRTLEAGLPPLQAAETRGRQVWLSRRKFWYAVAASAVIMASVVFALTNYVTIFGPKDLYVKYFEPFDSPGTGLTRSSDNEMSLKAQAYEAYDAGNYAAAVPLFEQLLPDKDEAFVHLCLASSFMALNEFDRAEETLLHSLKAHPDLITQTKWYLALTYVKQGKLEKARASLWEISDSSTYGVKAKALLKDLD